MNRIALFISFVLLSTVCHLVALLVHFVPPEPTKHNDEQSIEIVLVNSRSSTAPLSDFKYAQQNLDGGGNTDQKNQSIQTPLPATEDSNETVEETQVRQSELEQAQQQLMTQIKNSDRAIQQPTPQEEAKPQETPPGEALDLRYREDKQLMGEIAKKIQEYQTRPRRSFVGARTRSKVEAAYVESVRLKIENMGDTHYPGELQRRKLYGSVLMNIDIKADGTLEKVEIRKGSGSPMIDQAAITMVRMGEPYAPFPPELKKTTDILGISRYITFTSTGTFETSGAGYQ